jgi:hypothetical protein
MPNRRPQKITLAEMREASVRGLLVYCADYRSSHSIAISGDAGPMMSGCPISRSASPVGSAVIVAPMCGRISIGAGNKST